MQALRNRQENERQKWQDAMQARLLARKRKRAGKEAADDDEVDGIEAGDDPDGASSPQTSGMHATDIQNGKSSDDVTRNAVVDSQQVHELQQVRHNIEAISVSIS